MSNYNYPRGGTVTFGSRDALPPNNVEKIVKGSQLDLEFNELASVSDTKLDKNGTDFTGIISAGEIIGGTY